MSLFTETLVARLSQMNLTLQPAQTALCEEYFRRVTEANAHLNLTRITEPVQAAQQHFADAMFICSVWDIPQQCRMIDVGTGAGFPGVPLLILRPDIRMTLLDASGKKTDFVRRTLEALGLGAEIICGRAEELRDIHGSYDAAVSRAVSPLRILLELCIPLLKTGGMLASWKGEQHAQECDEAAGALEKLGCAISASHPIGRGALLLIEKQKPTPKDYPRRFSKIKNNPL
jgi:16S rRNA (guanine527-N7)-methyltransferase